MIVLDTNTHISTTKFIISFRPYDQFMNLIQFFGAEKLLN